MVAPESSILIDKTQARDMGLLADSDIRALRELQTPPRLTPAPHILRVIHRIPKSREFALGRWRNRTDQCVDDRRIPLSVTHDVAVMQIADEPSI